MVSHVHHPPHLLPNRALLTGGSFASPEMPVITTHHGQHSPECYGCKLNSLTFNTGQPKTHVKKGDPWKDNPVAERIEELHAAGRKVAAYEIKHGLGDGSSSGVMPPTESADSSPKE